MKGENNDEYSYIQNAYLEMKLRNQLQFLRDIQKGAEPAKGNTANLKIEGQLELHGIVETLMETFFRDSVLTKARNERMSMAEIKERTLMRDFLINNGESIDTALEERLPANHNIVDLYFKLRTIIEELIQSKDAKGNLEGVRAIIEAAKKEIPGPRTLKEIAGRKPEHSQDED